MTLPKKCNKPATLGCADLFEVDWLFHNSWCPFDPADYPINLN